MLDAPQSNFGWVLVADSEGAGDASAKRFDSRENSSPDFRPVLQIVYSSMIATDAGVDAGLDAGRNDDAGVPDSGSPDGGTIDAGSPDAGSLGSGIADAGGDGGTNSPVSTAMQELGVGCQAAPGSLLAVLGLALLAFKRTRRRR
jgi:MYXO-CTERM domain-containing protein